MDYKDQIPQISAEMYLERLYPELRKLWTTRARGTFFRNYSHDIIDLDTEAKQVTLSRDGYLKLLPQGLVTQEVGSLKKKESPEELKKRVEILGEAFVPFDTFIFRRRLNIERQTSALLENKLHYILKTYFNFDLKNEKNEYVREVAVLLPFVSKLRANVPFVTNLLKNICKCDVNVVKTRYSEIDDTKCWIPYLRFELLISNLDNKQYNEKTLAIKPLANFIKEWFIPYDVKCDISIKQHDVPLTTQHEPTLEYNTYLHSENK